MPKIRVKLYVKAYLSYSITTITERKILARKRCIKKIICVEERKIKKTKIFGNFFQHLKGADSMNAII